MMFKFKCDFQFHELRCATWTLFYLKGQSLRSEHEVQVTFAVRLVGLGFWISLDKIYHLIECGSRFIIRSMGEDRTRELPDNSSFEERVFARFDAMNTRFDAMEARFDVVDARLAGLDTRVQVLEAKAYDTKPIWERALAEILNVKERMENIERKFDVLIQDMMQLRGDQRRVESQFDALKSKLA
jgi:tetrahydromethanopterin S-methyltransferase subunit G